MATYQATAENPKYVGKVAGVLFVDGKATLDESTVQGGDRTLAQVVRLLKDLGVTITEIFKCSVCGLVFETKNALSGHMKVHRTKEEAPKEEKIAKE